LKVFSESKYTVAWHVGKINPPAYSATCIIKGTFSLKPGGKAEPVEEHDPLSGDLFVDDNTEKSCIYESDFACYKPRADILLVGKCHTPRQESLQGCRVTLQVGAQKKSLYVFGDRFWQKNRAGAWTISEPIPFTEMPLIFENSFGGPGFADNPCGKGNRKLTRATGEEYWPLPNIEDPRRLLIAPDQCPDPAGFAPLGRMWPRRSAGKVGTYDDLWLNERWPYFPTDFDWGYFNCAPPDMQCGYLGGDEALYFENLHPIYAHYNTQLPCLRARLFVTELKEGEKRFREIKLNLDTLWVTIEEEKLHLVWRGVIEIGDEEITAIEQCLVVSESLDMEPEPLEYYQALLLRRLQEEQEEDEEEDPSPVIVPFDDSWVKEMDADFARMEEDFKKIEAEAAESEKEVRKMLVEAGIDPAELDRAQNAAAQMSLKDMLTKSAKQEQQMRESSPELAGKMPLPMTAEEIEEIDQSFQFEPTMDDFEPMPEPLTREDCEHRITGKENFENADLAGLDLTGLDFSGCNCCNTNFAGTLLQGAKFSAANLAGANLAACDLSNIDFQGANLAGADGTGAIMNLANFDGAILDDADFSGAFLEKASFNQAHGFRAIFVSAHLKGAKFVAAEMQEADFEGAVLEETDFTRANLREASVEGAKGKGIKMEAAIITGLHASEGPDFSEGNFKNVQAVESNWEAAILDRADFSGASLFNADFAKTSLRQARFSGADLTKARFEKADLTDAGMTYVNLFRGSFDKAKLIRTDLRGANCYEVAFYLTEIENVQFDGANLKMTKFAVKV
jgi:uncharacterized protein YjbI with pentapeptide repeats